MNGELKLGLIINTWQQPDYLGRVLRALSAQVSSPEEVLLADDGSEDQTRTVFETWSRGQSFPTAHVWQKHEGFRRARILNQAIARATSQYLVFLDGDTVPHPRFISDHRQLANETRIRTGAPRVAPAKGGVAGLVWGLFARTAAALCGRGSWRGSNTRIDGRALWRKCERTCAGFEDATWGFGAITS